MIGCYLLHGVDLQTWAAETKAYYMHVTYLYDTVYGARSWGDAPKFSLLLDIYAANLVPTIS